MRYYGACITLNHTLIRTSADSGITWSVATSGTPNTLYGITPADSGFIAVGASGTILRSADGSNWTDESPGGPDLFSVGVSGMMGSTYEAVGAGGTMLTYINPAWSPSLPTTSKTLYSHGGSLIVGAEGIVLTQPMLAVWVANPYSGTANTLRSIAWNGYVFAAVGELNFMDPPTIGSTFIQSDCGATPGASCGFWQKVPLIDAAETIRKNLYGVAASGNTDFGVVGEEYIKYALPPSQSFPGTGYMFQDIAGSGNALAVGIAGSQGIYYMGWLGPLGEARLAGYPAYSATWDGRRFVAVGGDSTHGQIEIGAYTTLPGDPPTSMFEWTPIWPDPPPHTLYSIVWNGSQFVVVGAAGTILTSDDGTTWVVRTSPVTNQDLRSVIWTGTQFVAVGTAGTILTSPNGIDWANRSGAIGQDLYDVSWSGDQLVAVGQGGLIAISDCSWGGSFRLSAGKWTQVALPAQPAVGANTVQDIFGDNFPGKTYSADWVLYKQKPDNTYQKLLATDVLEMGVGYWIKSLTAADLDAPNTATATPLIVSDDCAGTGCFEITLNTPLSAGTNRYNFVGMGLPYPVAWSDARVVVDGIAYVLSAAKTANLVDNAYYVYNGSAFLPYTDDSIDPAGIGIPQPFQGLWMTVLPGSYGKTVKLLLPAIPKLSQVPAVDASAIAQAEPAGFWSRLLDIVIPPAAADPLETTDEASPQAAANPQRTQAVGERERDARRNAHSSALQDGTAWFIRLNIEDPATGMKDRGNIGQLTDGAVGYDRYDVKELPPFGKPYLNLTFPHPEWGVKAGDYATDYRSTDRTQRGALAANWRFEIRTDQIGRQLQLRWQGPDAVLRRSVLFDEDTKISYPLSNPRYAQGIPVAMPKLVHRFTWRYADQAQGRSGKDD